MTKEHIKRIIPILQAFAEGKTIQANYDETAWMDVSDRTTVFDLSAHYRIKPEHRDWWIIEIASENRGFAYPTLGNAREHNGPGYPILHVREVI